MTDKGCPYILPNLFYRCGAREVEPRQDYPVCDSSCHRNCLKYISRRGDDDIHKLLIRRVEENAPTRS